MFQTAQWAQGSAAAQSLAQMAARGAKENTTLSSVVRERQDLVGEWQRRDAVPVLPCRKRRTSGTEQPRR
jgi:hypothetical protein